MSHKKNLLSIGDFSNVTGASIRSLRYYDRIKILQPTFTDPDSGYRYYSLTQIHMVEFIMFCIELGIPLMKVSDFIATYGTVDAQKFLQDGRELAIRKRAVLERGITTVDSILKKLDFDKKYENGQIYTRHIPKKTFHIKPYLLPVENDNPVDRVKEYINMSYYNKEDYSDWPNVGTLYEYLPSGINSYLYVDVPEQVTELKTITIPAGMYACMRSDQSQIKEAPEIFKDFLNGQTTFTVIETYVYAADFISPRFELMVIAADE